LLIMAATESSKGSQGASNTEKASESSDAEG
jgi:hypothetical protein